jgi:hypothetical protein
VCSGTINDFNLTGNNGGGTGTGGGGSGGGGGGTGGLPQSVLDAILNSINATAANGTIDTNSVSNAPDAAGAQHTETRNTPTPTPTPISIPVTPNLTFQPTPSQVRCMCLPGTLLFYGFLIAHVQVST